MRKKSLTALVLAVFVAAIAAGTAIADKATVVRGGNLVLRVNGGVTPKKLPKRKLAPITLRASANLNTVDGTQPPVTKKVIIDFDKHGTTNAKGLPVCHPGQLQARDTKHAKEACKKSIVGQGKTTVQVKFPEQPAFRSTGPLIAFNGGVKRGTTTMLIHAYVNVPAPTAIVTKVKIKKIHKGRYGTRAIAAIPKIAGGSGALLKFNLKIHRDFKRHGRKQSYLMARCANGRFFAHARSFFSDGSKLSGTITRGCKQR